MQAEMIEWMDGWMDGWVGGWVGGWMKGWMVDDKAGLSNLCQEFQEFYTFQISLKRHSSFSSYSISLIFTRKNRHVAPPCNKARIQNVDCMNNY